jgi:hypothetical protein
MSRVLRAHDLYSFFFSRFPLQKVTNNRVYELRGLTADDSRLWVYTVNAMLKLMAEESEKDTQKLYKWVVRMQFFTYSCDTVSF